MPDSIDSERLARIDQKVISMEQWQQKHDQHDDTRFERTFAYVKEGFAKNDEQNKTIIRKLDTLWDTKNQQEGGLKVGKILSTALMAFVGVVAGYFGGHVK